MGLIEYFPMGKERKKAIDDIVADLREKYLRKDGKFDYDSICRDNDIKYYEHWSVTYPCANLSERLIFNLTSRNEKGNEAIKLHEFGHLLLGHGYGSEPGIENEAWYFARNMLRMGRLSSFFIITKYIMDQAMVSQYRISTYRDQSGTWEDYWNRLRELAKDLDPIHPKPVFKGPWS